jgi:hypothetical protein
MWGNSHQNFIFVKLKVVWQPNKIINFTNTEAELLCGEVELKLSSSKQVLKEL